MPPISAVMSPPLRVRGRWPAFLFTPTSSSSTNCWRGEPIGQCCQCFKLFGSVALFELNSYRCVAAGLMMASLSVSLCWSCVPSPAPSETLWPTSTSQKETEIRRSACGFTLWPSAPTMQRSSITAASSSWLRSANLHIQVQSRGFGCIGFLSEKQSLFVLLDQLSSLRTVRPTVYLQCQQLNLFSC